MKELFIEAHEELIEAKMEKWAKANPNHTSEEYFAAEQRFYDSTVDAAYSCMQDKFADMVDTARQRAKDGRL